MSDGLSAAIKTFGRIRKLYEQGTCEKFAGDTRGARAALDEALDLVCGLADRRGPGLPSVTALIHYRLGHLDLADNRLSDAVDHFRDAAAVPTVARSAIPFLLVAAAQAGRTDIDPERWFGWGVEALRNRSADAASPGSAANDPALDQPEVTALELASLAAHVPGAYRLLAVARGSGRLGQGTFILGPGFGETEVAWDVALDLGILLRDHYGAVLFEVPRLRSEFRKQDGENRPGLVGTRDATVSVRVAPGVRAPKVNFGAQQALVIADFAGGNTPQKGTPRAKSLERAGQNLRNLLRQATGRIGEVVECTEAGMKLADDVTIVAVIDRTRLVGQ